jgi:hypothetical protein
MAVDRRCESLQVVVQEEHVHERVPLVEKNEDVPGRGHDQEGSDGGGGEELAEEAPLAHGDQVDENDEAG